MYIEITGIRRRLSNAGVVHRHGCRLGEFSHRLWTESVVWPRTLVGSHSSPRILLPIDSVRPERISECRPGHLHPAYRYDVITGCDVSDQNHAIQSIDRSVHRELEDETVGDRGHGHLLRILVSVARCQWIRDIVQLHRRAEARRVSQNIEKHVVLCVIV